MPSVRLLNDEELLRNRQHLGALKCELQKLASLEDGTLETAQGFIDYLGWCQYEGIQVGLDGYLLTHCTLLLIVEYLEEACGMSLRKCNDELVLVHPRIVGACPLEMLAYRPLQPGEGSWADTELVDRALYSMEFIETALRSRTKELTWPRILLGQPWTRLMQYEK